MTNSKDSKNTKDSKNSKDKEINVGSIPRPVFVVLIILAAMIKILIEYWIYFVSIGAIIIICIVICLLFNWIASNPRFKIFITIIASIISIIIACIIIPHTKVSPQYKKAISEASLIKIKSVTVHGGYKPCFGSGNNYSSKYSQIAIKGNIKYDDHYFLDDTGVTANPQLNTKSVNDFFIKSTGKNAPKSNSHIWGIFFLTKIDNTITYNIDDYIPYEYTGDDRNDLRGLIENITTPTIIQYSDKALASTKPIFDTWILENAD